MAKKLNKILIVDIEATCWQGEIPNGQKSEIIEIGSCLLDLESLQISHKNSLLVKPLSSQISQFCTQLTSLTSQDIQNKGVSLGEACLYLRNNFDSHLLTWASYGDYDRKQFAKECSEKNLSYPFSSSHLNIKNLYALLEGQREMGMAEALQKIGTPLEGRHHRGDDDAWNIAKILAYIIKKYRLNGSQNLFSY